LKRLITPTPGGKTGAGLQQSVKRCEWQQENKTSQRVWHAWMHALLTSLESVVGARPAVPCPWRAARSLCWRARTTSARGLPPGA